MVGCSVSVLQHKGLAQLTQRACSKLFEKMLILIAEQIFVKVASEDCIIAEIARLDVLHDA